MFILQLIQLKNHLKVLKIQFLIEKNKEESSWNFVTKNGISESGNFTKEMFEIFTQN